MTNKVRNFICREKCEKEYVGQPVQANTLSSKI